MRSCRLPVEKFEPRRDQRQALHRWNRYVLGDDYLKEASKLYPASKVAKARDRNKFDFQRVLHEAEFSGLPSKPTPDHQFSVKLEPSDFTEAKFQLYSRYQQHVHGDDLAQCTESGFRSFLCESPLLGTQTEVYGVGKHLGTYHQCYYLDDKLIAMGVIDILPDCVSGVYFVYDPQYEKFSLGKISALTEIGLAQKGKYEFYYMGYYIHSCGKMRYKNDYQPQYFLDYETYGWDRLDADALRLMDGQHYLSISKLRKENNNLPISQIQTEPEPDYSQVGIEHVRAMEAKNQAGTPIAELGFAGAIPTTQIQETLNLDCMKVRLNEDDSLCPCDVSLFDECRVDVC